MRQRWLALAIAATVVVGLTGLMWRVRAANGPAAATEGAAAVTEHAPAADEHGEHEGEEAGHIEGLQTKQVDLSAVTQVLTLNAEVQHDADHSAKVGSPVSGRVVSIKARVGDFVRPGQMLAEVASRDMAEAKSALIRAQAEERAASGRLGTLRQLAGSGALTQAPLEAARRDHFSSAASVKQAQSDVTRARSARDAALAELERVKKLAEARAFQAGPVEDAERDVAEARMELETAQASVHVKQLAYDRSRRLLDAGIVAKREVEAAEAELAEARSRQSEARTHLDVASRTLQREQNISGQDLYTVAEVRQAQEAIRQAERDLQVTEAEVERARGHMDVASAALARERRIADRGLLAKRELQEAEAALTIARAQVAAAQSTLAAFSATGARRSGGLANIAISTPMGGVITRRDASPGQAVEASADLFTVHSIDPVWVIASAHQKDLPRIGKGQSVHVRLKGYPDDAFSGSIAQIERELDTATRTARIRCVVRNPAGVLRPGMFATVDVVTDQDVQALLVPHSAVLDEDGSKVLFVRCMECPEDREPGGEGCGSYDKLRVKLGPRYGEDVQIIEGLEPGAEVVVTGQHQLKTALGSGTLDAGHAGHGH